jgi:hypothetical protein
MGTVHPYEQVLTIYEDAAVHAYREALNRLHGGALSAGG